MSRKKRRQENNDDEDWRPKKKSLQSWDQVVAEHLEAAKKEKEMKDPDTRLYNSMEIEVIR